MYYKANQIQQNKYLATAVLNPALPATTHPHLLGSQSSSNVSTCSLWRLQLGNPRKPEFMVDISEENWLQVEHQKCQRWKSSLYCKGQMTASLSLAWQLLHLFPLALAVSHVPCDHCIKERTGSKPLQECFILRSEIRTVTYLLCRTNKQSVTASSSAGEGRKRIPLPPAPAQAWKWLPVRVPAGGAGAVCRQAEACDSTHRKGRVRFPDQGVQRQLRWRAIGTHCKVARTIYSEITRTLSMHHVERAQEYNCLIRAMMWKVKLKTNEAKARKMYYGGAAKTRNDHIPPWGFMQGLTHSLSSSSRWPVSAFGISHFRFKSVSTLDPEPTLESFLRARKGEN